MINKTSHAIHAITYIGLGCREAELNKADFCLLHAVDGTRCVGWRVVQKNTVD